MTCDDVDIETWFDAVAAAVLERCGVEFKDEDSVADDYKFGKDAFEVADEIAAEYKEGQ